MPHDDQRPNRLAPPRPDYEWGTESRSSPQQRPRAPARRPNWDEEWDMPGQTDEKLEGDVLENDFSFSGEPGEMPVFKKKPEGQGSRGRRDAAYEGQFTREERTDLGTRPPVPASAFSAESTSPPPREPAARPEQPETKGGPQELSVQERHQLLIRTIELYDDVWKLAGIRANEKRNRVEAYLIPRDRRIDLKEAISKNLALIITVDTRGNTDIHEPKSKGPLRKFTTWLFGD